jgi:hypothetical protein
MPKFKAFAATIIIPGLLLSGGSFAAAAEGGTADSKQCEVKIDRSREAGVYNVTRQVFEDGNCICYAYTGPSSQASSIESAISELLASKSCSGAPVQMIAGAAPAAAAIAGTTGAGGLAGAAVVAPAVAGGAAAAAIAAGDSNNPGSP